MINDLKKIAEECRDAPVKVFLKGNLKSVCIDSKARSVAVSAINAARDMLGYKAPEKVELTTISSEREKEIEEFFRNKDPDTK